MEIVPWHVIRNYILPAPQQKVVILDVSHWVDIMVNVSWLGSQKTKRGGRGLCFGRRRRAAHDRASEPQHWPRLAHGADLQARMSAWSRAVAASQQLADEWQAWLARPDMALVGRL